MSLQEEELWMKADLQARAGDTPQEAEDPHRLAKKLNRAIQGYQSRFSDLSQLVHTLAGEGHGQ